MRDGGGCPGGGEIALVVLETAFGVCARLWHGSARWLTLGDMIGVEGMIRRVNLPLVRGGRVLWVEAEKDVLNSGTWEP